MQPGQGKSSMVKCSSDLLCDIALHEGGHRFLHELHPIPRHARERLHTVLAHIREGGEADLVESFGGSLTPRIDRLEDRYDELLLLFAPLKLV